MTNGQRYPRRISTVCLRYKETDMSQTSLVTGGTSGIGWAVARKLLAASTDPADRIIINYGHDDSAAQSCIASFSVDQQAKVVLVKADLSQRDTLSGFVTQISSITSHIDYLVLNTGVGTYKPFFDYSFEDWDQIIETNLTIPVFLAQQLRPLLAENASIVFTGSYAGIVPYSTSLAYGVSKAGLLFAAKALVKEFEDKAVRVNAVAPGFVETPWQEGRSQESRDRINAKIALHRFGAPEEVAEAVYALLTNTYINGSVLEIHGGYGYF